MGFGNLTYLMALAGITLPILIHLWSRKTPKTLPFGSIRFLHESETRTLRSIRPSELLLLLLRIGIIATLVLILSAPWSYTNREMQQTAILVDPEYADREEVIQLRDTSSASMYWLASGLPGIDIDTNEIRTTSVWSLAPLINSLPFKEIVILSPRRYAAFGGPSSTFSNDLLWQSLPVHEVPTEVDTISSKGHSLIISSEPNEPHSQFRQTPIQDVRGTPLQITVCITADAQPEELAKVLRSALEAINTNGQIDIVASSDIADADWLFWLKREPAPPRDHLLVINDYERDVTAIAPHLYQIGSDLTAVDFISQHIPLQLEAMFTQDLMDIDQYDQRKLPPEQIAMFASEQEAVEGRHEKQSWQSLLWLVLVCALLAERWWSLKTSQS